MKVDWYKIIGAVAFGGYFLRAAATPSSWHLIDGANLVFHEAGHTLFMWGPEWLHVAGGSLFQVGLPAALAAVAWRQHRRFTAMVLLMWAGQSLVNVSVYADDALRQQLPLISDYAEHDWNYLLWRFGQLRHIAQIAATIKAIGLVTLAAAVGGAVYGAAEKEQEKVAVG